MSLYLWISLRLLLNLCDNIHKKQSRVDATFINALQSYTWFFLLQKLRQSVDCFIYCSIYKGTDMILCCWHLLTYQKINSIGRSKKRFLTIWKVWARTMTILSNQGALQSAFEIICRIQWMYRDKENAWKTSDVFFWIFVLDETKPRFIALDIMITKLGYMFQSQIIPIGVQVV